MPTPVFLLYGLTFVPIAAGEYTEALIKAREAAFIQSGIAEDWHQVRQAAEKRVPKGLKHLGVAYTLIHKQELRLKTSGAVIHLKKDSATLSWGFSW